MVYIKCNDVKNKSDAHFSPSVVERFPNSVLTAPRGAHFSPSLVERFPNSVLTAPRGAHFSPSLVERFPNSVLTAPRGAHLVFCPSTIQLIQSVMISWLFESAVQCQGEQTKRTLLGVPKTEFWKPCSSRYLLKKERQETGWRPIQSQLVQMTDRLALTDGRVTVEQLYIEHIKTMFKWSSLALTDTVNQSACSSLHC
jgi:hypothetical protein